MIHDHYHDATPARDRRVKVAGVTCLTICIALLLLASIAPLWLSTRSQLPPTRPATFVVKYEDYLAHVLGPVDLKQMIEVSSGRCYVIDPPKLGNCTVTEAELDALYQVLRDTQFDTINNPWFLPERCSGDRTTLITMTINEIKYIKDQPTGCNVDSRWQTVVGTIRNLISAKRHS